MDIKNVMYLNAFNQFTIVKSMRTGKKPNLFSNTLPTLANPYTIFRLAKIMCFYTICYVVFLIVCVDRVCEANCCVRTAMGWVYCLNYARNANHCVVAIASHLPDPNNKGALCLVEGGGHGRPNEMQVRWWRFSFSGVHTCKWTERGIAQMRGAAENGHNIFSLFSDNVCVCLNIHSVRFYFCGAGEGVFRWMHFTFRTKWNRFPTYFTVRIFVNALCYACFIRFKTWMTLSLYGQINKQTSYL